MQSLASKTIKGVLWSAVEKFSLQGVQLGIGIVLARLLTPTDFGMIGMMSIFLSVSRIFIDCGFTNALIRQKDVSNKDYGTAFSLNLVVSILAFLILYAIAPFVSDFYSMPELQGVMRVLSFTLVINAFYTVHKAKLTKMVDFKTQSIVSFLAATLSGVFGIWLAYTGHGVWSLVWQNIVGALLEMLMLLVVMRWVPCPAFDRTSFKNMFSFGSKLLIANIISTIYANLYNVVIGKKYTASDLGFYARAEHFAYFPSVNISGILSRVSYPLLSEIQDDSVRLKNVYEKYLKVSCFVVFPLMFGLMAVAKPMILVLLGEKWLFSVILLQILCIGCMLDPICGINLNLLYVKGRSDLVLRLEIIKKTIAVIIICCTLNFGLVWMCVGRAIYGIVATYLNTFYTGRFIDESTWQQVKLLLPYYVLSALMGAAVYGTTMLFDNNLIKLIVGIVVGIVFYVGLAYVFKMEAFADALSIVKKKKNG